jgi:hypothetical protein
VAPGGTPPILAGNGTGESALVWYEGDGRDPSPGSWVIKAAVRAPGAEFGPAQTIFLNGPNEHPSSEPFVAVSESGAAMVLFVVDVPSGFAESRLLAAVRPAGAARFDEPVELDDVGAFASSPRVGFDRSGNALITWTRRRGRGPDELGRDITAVRYLPEAGGFKPAQTLAIPGETAGQRRNGLAVSPTGAAIMAWASTRGATTRMAVAIGDTERGFEPPVVVSGQAAPKRFDVAAGADGTRAAAWRGGKPGASRVQVARVGPVAKRISSRDTRTLSAKRAAELAVAIDDVGGVTVAWSRYLKFPGPLAVEAATAAPSRHFAQPRLLSSKGSSYGASPALGINSRGDRFLVWGESTPPSDDRVAHWALAPSNGRFGNRGRMMRASGMARVRLYRGPLGSMLATVLRSTVGETSWSLFTYGER